MQKRPRSGILLGITVTVFTWLGAATGRGAPTPATPVSVDPSIRITLFASEPDIVTPIGATVDSRGRLLVIESHTHFRPKDYQGPPTDRIRVLEDTTGSGKADRISTFYQGEGLLMNLVAERDGSVVVSSRNEIFRLLAPDAGGVATKKVTLAHLETKSNYPHNGLHGLAVGPDGTVYFGIGENLGGPWVLVGTDGRKISDSTGTGAIFRVDGKGAGLTRVCRGFWNPFGIGLDPMGDVWVVDNDPDGRPPCRLIQAVLGGDFGYEYRYGRTGMHPLQTWDGDLPGTLGMVSGVGEAPCAVVWGQGRLFVSSWRDHQVEAYTLSPRGASFTATMKPLVTGGENFRPVGLAVAPDGSLFINDRASSSYPVHGKGHVWKVTFKHPETAPAGAELQPTAAWKRAASLRSSEDLPTLLTALDDADPYTAQAAQYGLSRQAALEKIDFASLKTARQRIGVLAALLCRGADATPFVAPALQDSDDQVRQMAVRVIAEQPIASARGALDSLLASQALSPRLLGMTVATINQLDGDPAAKIDSKKINAVLLSRLNAPGAGDDSKASALHMMQAGHPHIDLVSLRTLLDSSSAPLQRETVRYLAADTDPGRFGVLAQVGGDAKRDAEVRGEAVDGLADDADGQKELLLKLAGGADAVVRQEALRSLRPVAPKLNDAQKQELLKVADGSPADADLVYRALGKLPASRPGESDMAAWQKVLDAGAGNPDAGRRTFFHPAGPGCFRCHMIEGRGHAIGPDLTMIGQSRTRQNVLESIVDPSREIAPLYTLWTIQTKSGHRIDGMLLRRDGQENEIYVDASGQEIKVREPDVAERKIRTESLMPTGLVQGMTDQELRDVVAFLTAKR